MDMAHQSRSDATSQTYLPTVPTPLLLDQAQTLVSRHSWVNRFFRQDVDHPCVKRDHDAALKRRACGEVAMMNNDSPLRLRTDSILTRRISEPSYWAMRLRVGGC